QARGSAGSRQAIREAIHAIDEVDHRKNLEIKTPPRSGVFFLLLVTLVIDVGFPYDTGGRQH
ncbi:MAG: hypothetical protein NTV44_05885, partial [Firmicutes bacterium]|nr:hypothetical protein [Bacillota bacterium]